MENIKQIIVETLKEHNLIRLCILYGSGASGRLTYRSDIDIAVAGNYPFDKEYLVELQLLLSSKLGYEVDLIDMNYIEGLILTEIIKKGVVLINNDKTLYASFIKKTIYFTEDVLPNIRMILTKRAVRFAGGQRLDTH